MKASSESDKALLQKSSLEIKLLPESAEDRRVAELFKYQDTDEGSMYFIIISWIFEKKVIILSLKVWDTFLVLQPYRVSRKGCERNVQAYPKHGQI